MPDFGTDVDAAKTWYCSQFVHAGCGGAPVAANQRITCDACGHAQDWKGTLGDELATAPWIRKGQNVKPIVKPVAVYQPCIFG